MSTGLVALTGGTGFIGRYLLQTLPQRGYELRVLVRSATALPAGCRSAVIGDLARPLNLAAALEGVEAVVHSAGPSSPMPLPFARLDAPRSLLSLENLVDAIHTVLTTPAQLRRPFIVADPAALTVAEMLTAIRFGLGRRPGLFPVPVRYLKAALRTVGREKDLRLLTEPLVASAAALRGLGWEPSISTPSGLAALAKLDRGGDDRAPTSA